MRSDQAREEATCARGIDGVRCNQPAVAIVFVPDYEDYSGFTPGDYDWHAVC